MENLFVCKRASRSTKLPNFDEWINQNGCLCRVSVINLIAFTSHHHLRDSNCYLMVNHVYVADLNLPMEPCLITSHSHAITSMEWSEEGERLMIGDNNGKVEIWARPDGLLNRWKLVQRNVCFPGEYVMASIWFRGLSIKYHIDYEKRDLACSYQNKFINQNYSHTVRKFGGAPVSGYLAISNSALVMGFCIMSDFDRGTDPEKLMSNPELSTEMNNLWSTSILGKCRNRVKLIDYAYFSTGQILIAYSNGSADCTIQCTKLSLKLDDLEKLTDCSLTIENVCYNSFYPSMACENAKNDPKARSNMVTHLQFLSRDDPNILLVVCENFKAYSYVQGESEQSDFCTIELWELKETPVKLNQLFTNDQTPTTQLLTKEWRLITNVRQQGCILGLTCAPQTILDKACARQNGLIALACADGEIKCLSKDNLNTIFACKMAISNQEAHPFTEIVRENSSEEDVEFGARYFCSERKVDLAFTWSQSLLISLESDGTLCAFRLQPICADNSTLSLNHSLTLMEYSLISGYDWMDVLLNVRPYLVEPLCQRFEENFTQQTTCFQQQHFLRMLMIKSSLYRCVSVHKAGDCHAQLLLYSIVNLLRQLLRSRESERESPADQLFALIDSHPNELQMNQIFVQLDHKEFCVESNLLQSLQPLNQWIGDLALFLAASIPHQYQNSCRFPGGGLIYDKKALNVLREMLTLFRVWSLLNETCLPMYTRISDNVDIIALLYKVITRCAQGEPYDDALLEECIQLPNQIFIPHIPLALRPLGVCSPAIFSVPPVLDLPINLQYFRFSTELHTEITVPILKGTMANPPGTIVDAIRYVHLGGADLQAHNVRMCTRCSSFSLLHSPINSIVIRSWDQRWSNNCICGGFWRLCGKYQFN